MMWADMRRVIRMVAQRHPGADAPAARSASRSEAAVDETKNRGGPRQHGCHAGSSALADVRPETREELEAMCRPRQFSAGQTVIHEDEKTDYVGCVLSGVLRMQKTLADGRQHIVGLLVEGDMFGRVFDGASEFSVEAATDVEFCSFPRGPFEALLLRAPDLDRAVLLNILNELDRARDWMLILSNQKISSRLAGFLVLMVSRFAHVDRVLAAREDGLVIRIPINRTDLSHLLGTRPESISRAFHWLQDEGDIELLEHDRILVRDPERLANRAGEDEFLAMASVRDRMAAGRSSS